MLAEIKSAIAEIKSAIEELQSIPREPFGKGEWQKRVSGKGYQALQILLQLARSVVDAKEPLERKCKKCEEGGMGR